MFESSAGKTKRRKKTEDENVLFASGKRTVRKEAEAPNRMSDESVGALKPLPMTERHESNRYMLDGVLILIVDDSLDLLCMLKIIFDECGAEVITASSAKEALEALESHSPDVLVSDIVMPDQDGYELIRKIRRRGADQGGNMPAVALTGNARVEDYMYALDSGFQLCLAKPVEFDLLIAAVMTLTCSNRFDRCA